MMSFGGNALATAYMGISVPLEISPFKIKQHSCSTVAITKHLLSIVYDTEICVQIANDSNTFYSIMTNIRYFSNF